MAPNLKFRAWDKKAKKWLLGYEYPNLGGFSLFGECMLLGEWSRILNDYVLNPEMHNHGEDDLVVTQFTGLHDCNGKEIYEGDIVKWNHACNSEDNGIDEVIFRDGLFGFKIEKGGYSLEAFTRELDNIFIEVIGNIYEHPELLNK
jgi:uncharacterized phage protein (TIGR01671 family)